MPIDFPSSPLTGQSYTYGSKEWIWNGTEWAISNRSSSGVAGATGASITIKGGANVGIGGITSGICTRSPYGIGTQSIQSYAAQYFPIWIENTTTVDRIAVRTGSTTGNTGTMVLGIYNNSNPSGRPGTLRLEAGSVDFSAANTTYSVTIDHTLERGWYWLASYARNGGSGTTWLGFGAYVDTWWNNRVFGDTGSVSGAMCPVLFNNPLTATFSNNPTVGYYGYNCYTTYLRVK